MFAILQVIDVIVNYYLNNSENTTFLCYIFFKLGITMIIGGDFCEKNISAN